MATYIGLTLTVVAVGPGRYSATLRHPDQKSPDAVEFAFSESDEVKDGKTFRSYFDRINELVAKPDEVMTVGQALYDRVFCDHLREAFETWYGFLKPDAEKFRLRLDIPKELIGIPWEIIRDNKGFLARRNTSIVRYLEHAPKPALQMNASPRALLASASPKGNLAFDEAKHVDPVVALLKGQDIPVDWIPGATHKKLLDQLRTQPYDIFHFVGHGTYDSKGGSITLVRDNGTAGPMSAGDLSAGLADSQVKLAYLCSCNTAETSDPNPFRGVAQNLVASGIPAVIAMQYRFPQEDSNTFGETFYRRLFETQSLDDAMYYARTVFEGDRVAWFIPVLYCQSQVPLLLPEPRQSRERPAPPILKVEKSNPFLPIGDPATPNRFCARAEIVSDLIDALIERRNVLVAGERRMGKTSVLQYLTHDQVLEEHGLDPKRSLHIFYDASISGRTDFSAFWRDVLQCLGRRVSENQNIQIEALCGQERLSEEDVGGFLKLLQQNREIAFFLDEFDSLLEQELGLDFFGFFTRLNEASGVRFIVSSRYRPVHYLRRGNGDAASFFDRCLVYDLRPPGEEGLEEFLQLHMGENEQVFTVDQRRSIARVSGYYLYYLRVACAEMFEARRQPAPADVPALFAERFWQQAEPSLADHWINSYEEERLMLAVLALRGQGSSRKPLLRREALESYCPQGPVTLEGMRHRGLVVEARDRVSLFSRAFEAWILASLSSSRNTEEAAREYLEKYAGSYHDLITKTDHRVCRTFARANPKHWDWLTRWCRQPRYHDLALSLLAMLPNAPFSPQTYLR